MTLLGAGLYIGENRNDSSATLRVMLSELIKHKESKHESKIQRKKDLF